MNGNCHFIFGAVTGTALALNQEKIAEFLPNIPNTPEMATLFVLGGLIGGIFPDIDNPVSYMGKLTEPLSKAIGRLGELTGNTGRNHRGIMHDMALYIAGIIITYLYFTPLLPFFAGCMTHLFLDMFNPSGIPFLFGVRRFHLGRVKSGSKESVIVTWICSAVMLAMGIAFRIGTLV